MTAQQVVDGYILKDHIRRTNGGSVHHNDSAMLEYLTASTAVDDANQ